VHLIAPIPELIDAECRIEVRPRSSALARHGVIIPTGTIDLGYRGELTAALYVAAPGGLAPDGIYALTQIVLSPGWRLIHCNISDDETARGHGGFGSTDGGAI
jgi:dUTPase